MTLNVLKNHRERTETKASERKSSLRSAHSQTEPEEIEDEYLPEISSYNRKSHAYGL